MFEARLTQGRIFKALIESIKDLVQDANIDCSEDELSIQAMDSSHVSLVAVTLRSSGFDHFRCDRPISLGFNSANMSKILKCAGNDDVVTLKAEDEGDTLTLMFESEGQDRIADFGTCRLFIFAHMFELRSVILPTNAPMQLLFVPDGWCPVEGSSGQTPKYFIWQCLACTCWHTDWQVPDTPIPRPRFGIKSLAVPLCTSMCCFRSQRRALGGGPSGHCGTNTSVAPLFVRL